MTEPESQDGRWPSGERADFYRLLQLDPDAPQELIVEAYWYVAGKLRAEQGRRKGVDHEIEALNAAYAEILVPERRAAYDAASPHLVELRQARDEARAVLRERPPLVERLRRRGQARPSGLINYYAVLCVDRSADAPLIARAYAILRSFTADGGDALRRTEEVVRAGATLLDSAARAAYDLSLVQAVRPVQPVAGEAEASRAGSESRPKARSRRAASAAERRQPSKPKQAASARRVLLIERGTVIWKRGAAGAARAAGRAGRLLVKAGAWTGARLASAWRAAARAAPAFRHYWRSRPRRAPALDQPQAVDRRVLREAIPALFRAESVETEKSARACLHIAGPAAEERVEALRERPVALGSDPTCDIVLDAQDGLVAAAHAQIWYTGDRHLIRSLSGDRPTLINSSQVSWAALDDGDEIGIGRYRMRFKSLKASTPMPDFLSARRGGP